MTHYTSEGRRVVVDGGDFGFAANGGSDLVELGLASGTSRRGDGIRAGEFAQADRSSLGATYFHIGQRGISLDRLNVDAIQLGEAAVGDFFEIEFAKSSFLASALFEEDIFFI